MTSHYMDPLQREANRMIETELTRNEFDRIVERVFPRDEQAGDLAVRRHAERMSTLGGLFTASPTNETIRGTRWAGYQAVTEYIDHYSKVRGNNPAVRAERVLASPHIANVKDAAFAAFALN